MANEEVFVDEFGLPIGPSRIVMLEGLCSGVLDNASQSEVNLFSPSQVSASADGGQWNGMVESLQISGPEDVWLLSAEPEVSVIVAVVGDDVGGRRAILVTRMGDSMCVWENEFQQRITLDHGEVDDPAVTSWMFVLRRIMGLPVDVDVPGPQVLLGAWVMRTVLGFITDVNEPVVSDRLRSMLRDVIVGVSGKLAGVPMDDVGEMWLDVKFLDETAEECIKLASWLRSWDDFVAAGFDWLLPEGFRTQGELAWAGDGLVSWWVFNHVVPLPSKSMEELFEFDQEVGVFASSWLKRVGWFE